MLLDATWRSISARAAGMTHQMLTAPAAFFNLLRILERRPVSGNGCFGEQDGAHRMGVDDRQDHQRDHRRRYRRRHRWGPFAGYFAKQQPIELDVVAVTPPADTPALPFVYDISMGVRRSDSALKDRLDDIIARRHDDIGRILTSYGGPLVADQKPAIRP